MNNNNQNKSVSTHKVESHIRPITEAQSRVLNFISKYIGDKCYPPSYRDISAEMDFASTNSVTNHLTALEQKGFIKTERGRARALVLTDKARAHIKSCKKEKTN